MDNNPLDLNIFPLQTPASLAVRWGVDRSLVQRRKERHEDFPKPVKGYVEGASSYYPLHEVERYEQARGFRVTGEEFVNNNCGKKGTRWGEKDE